MDFTAVGGLTLHYQQTGLTAGTPLVFINSLGSDLRIWDAVVASLAPQHPIVRYDKRGHGLSDSPPGPYAISDHTQDLVGLLDYLEKDEIILVGTSVGGMIALDFSHRYPERLRALILCDTAAKIGTAAYWNERIAAIEQQGMAAMADLILSRWFAPTFASQHPAAYQGYVNLLTRTSVAGYLATCATIRDADLRPALPHIKTNTLVLCGAEDNATTPDMVRALAQGLPQAQFDLIPQAGHTPSVENPQAMVARINHFLPE